MEAFEHAICCGGLTSNAQRAVALASGSAAPNGFHVDVGIVASRDAQHYNRTIVSGQSSRDSEPLRTKRSNSVTLADVSQDACVSIMTVSNVARGRTDLVKLETRRRVEESIARVGCRPNLSARNLRLSEQRSVIFVRPMLEWCAIEQREKGSRSVFGERIRDREDGHCADGRFRRRGYDRQGI